MTNDFFNKSLNTIELPSVLKMLSDEAVSESAKESAMKLLPSTVRDEVVYRLDETASAVKMMVLRGSPSFGGVKDIRPALERASLGGALNTRELLQIASVLRSSRLVKGYISDDSVGKTSIDFLFNALKANKFLEEKIFASIVTEDEIADSASADLADIRRKMRAAAAKARDALQKIISSPSYAKALQDNIITTRSDRFVVPVKAECKSAVPGLVHDISSTGATIFVEPMAAVKANNELRELAAKEKTEIERILYELSAECAEHKQEIDSDYSLLVRLDLIFAKAKLAYKMEACAANLSVKNVSLIHARHPLIKRESAVPIDVEIGKDYDTLIITGPNTGGKTVTLKTIGLLSAMNQCGLFIPCDDGSELPIFSNILADIGDEQSIEQSLSTFSSHMRNIVSILEECDENSLVLFDELGAGTDPAEGAALAVSIIEMVRRRGALTVATTHYTELKVYATNENGVQNASCEFDVDTLKPTYRLLLGIPGKSNAFAISKRLGLNEEIIEDAKKRVGADNAKFESTIEKLEHTRNLLDGERRELADKIKAAEENRKKAAALKAELDVRLEKVDIKAKREADEIIRQAKSTAEEVFRELDEMKSRINEDQSVSEINEARNKLRRKLNLAADETSLLKKEEDTRVSSRQLEKGDFVEVKNLGIKGIVCDISSDRTISVQAGIMKVTANESDVLLLDSIPSVKTSVKNRTPSVELKSAGVPSEIDLRGMECLEAVSVAEQYLDNALMAKMSPVTIIHGKGTGALRNAITQMLRKNKIVKSFRLGMFGEGESGVTVVELKIK